MTKVGEAYLGSTEHEAFNIVGATLVGVASAPMAGVAALALCVERGAWDPIYTDKRIGLDSVPFINYKLQTFRPGINGNSGEIETWGPLDPRATKLARFVRQVGIDEFPELLNVLKGEIGLVGIRPQVPSVLEQRKTVDKGIFDDWYWWYERNLGLFGAGQEYAHKVGHYQEGSALIRELMKRDIEASQTKSLMGDIKTVCTQPFTLLLTVLPVMRAAAAARS